MITQAKTDRCHVAIKDYILFDYPTVRILSAMPAKIEDFHIVQLQQPVSWNYWVDPYPIPT